MRLTSDSGAMPGRQHRCRDEAGSVSFWNAAWLVIARGGWWKVSEVLDQLSLDVDVRNAQSTLWIMAERHRMLVTRGHKETREYAVTAACRPPKQLTVAQIVEAVTGVSFRAEPFKFAHRGHQFTVEAMVGTDDITKVKVLEDDRLPQAPDSIDTSGDNA